MVGSNRIVTGNKIVNPLGNVDLDPKEEKELRRAIVEKALKALQTNVEEQTHFDPPTQ
jgi:glycine reductase